MQKNQRTLILLLLTFVLINGCKDDSQLGLEFENLPQASQEFLTEYFPEHGVVSITYDKPPVSVNLNEEEICLHVLLKEDIQVMFSKEDGNWIQVFAPDGIPEPATEILNNYVYTKLNRKENDAKITTLMPLYAHSILIGLDNGRKYAQSQLLEFDGITLAEVNVTDGNLKSKILSFLERNPIGGEHLTDYIFKITEMEGTAYRLFMGDELTISFDENANWIHARTGFTFPPEDNTADVNNFLNNVIRNEMPESISNIVRNQVDLGDLQVLASYGNGNYGLRFKNMDLLVNENSGIANHLLPAANRLVTDYWGSSYKLVYSNGITYVGAYRFNSTFIYEIGEVNVSIQVDMHGDWNRIYAARIENGKAVYLSLPPEITKELPDDVNNYLAENYEGSEIFRISQKLFFKNEFSVSITPNSTLYFNEDGSFKNKIDHEY